MASSAYLTLNTDHVKTAVICYMTVSPSWTVNSFRVGIVCVISVLSGSARSRPDFIHHLLGIPNDSAKDRRNEEVALGLMRLGNAISALTTLLVPIALGERISSL